MPKSKNMVTLGRLGIYLLMFIGSTLVIGSVTSFWHDLDYFLFGKVAFEDAQSIELRKDMVLVDIPYYAEGTQTFDRGNFRGRLANLLNTIDDKIQSNDQPKAVILDIYFTNDSEGLDSLKSAIQRLKDKNVKVYGVYDMLGHDETYFEKHDAKQARELYESYFDGFRLHTRIDHRSGVLSYDSDLEFKLESGGSQIIEALVVKVANDIKEENSGIYEPRSYILPIGNEASISSKTYQFLNSGNSITDGTFKPLIAGTPELNVNDKIIIVGSFAEDHLAGIDMTGTHLVSWALLDQLKNNVLSKQPLDNPIVYVVLVVFFGILTAMLFALLFKYVKSLQTKPLILSILAILLSSLILFGLFKVILTTGKVMPIGLALIAIIISGLLSWRFAYKFLVTGIAEGSEKYDVFISYSHGNSDWVKKNVFEPLDSFTINGKRLNIFFDVKSIGIGEQFTSKYMWGIVDSRIFIPIMSEEYYGKNHCRNEMDLAYKRSVEKLLHIMPIVFSYDCVPEIYTHINFTDITVNPNFIEAIKEEIAKRST